MVFRLAQTIVYHSECLRCHTCGEVLQLGDTYALLGGRKVVCAMHAPAALTVQDFKTVPQICDGVVYAEQQSAAVPTLRGKPETRKVWKPTKRSSEITEFAVQFNRSSPLPPPCLQQQQPQLQVKADCREANADLSAHSNSSPDVSGRPESNSIYQNTLLTRHG
ncbi:unnamed protein product [Schistocephalus solidus]|uniref:LIM zinc-binding domain-containing protein n=1 Tax=Schistocephalus solidus TaxID=70667 RepID=A0A183SCG3_SCHSO|nr:unnamed protein product [Schistocephalus solidus]